MELLAALIRANRAVKGHWLNTLEEINLLVCGQYAAVIDRLRLVSKQSIEYNFSFGAYSGFKVNWSKSINFPLDLLFAPTIPSDVPL